MSELPFSRKAEEALVGSVVIDPDAYEKVAPMIDASDIYLRSARMVWQVVEDLKERGDVPDFVTVNDELERREKLEELGGAAYVTRLFEAVPSALHAEQYAKTVREDAERRRLIRAAEEIAKAAYNEGLDVEEMQHRAESAVLGTRRNGSRTVTASEMFNALYEEIAEWQRNPSDMRGLPTGLDALDKMLGGLEPGLYLMAARPSMGKTAVALQIASNVARAGRKVVIFTLEMGERQLALRLACSEAGVVLDRVKRGVVAPAEMERVANAMGEQAEWPLVVHEGTVTVGDVRAVTRRESMTGEVGLVVVDYLGLMASAKEAQTRNLELGAISRGLLLAAKKMDVPILAIHQLSRAVERRNDKRPLLCDLRESGRLEEDADVVLMLYRDGYYNPPGERTQPHHGDMGSQEPLGRSRRTQVRDVLARQTHAVQAAGIAGPGGFLRRQPMLMLSYAVAMRIGTGKQPDHVMCWPLFVFGMLDFVLVVIVLAALAT